MMPPSLSICICTYNRGQSLKRTLTSLASQKGISTGDVEVVIVNNNCTDETDKVIEEFRCELPIRRVSESKQGLAHARNRAVSEFKGDVLVFTDDDVRFVSFHRPITSAEESYRIGEKQSPGGCKIRLWPCSTE
jgi:glycosyltransferase involved in cell wall biosynthesis